MGAKSKIEWTHHTFNAWVGCTKVSPACDHCYAEAMAKRAGWDVWGDNKPRRVTRDDYWKQPIRWNREAQKAGVRERVFCLSLGDVFERRADLEAPRARLGRLILDTPHLDWLLLTKRPENVNDMRGGIFQSDEMPPNVWLGTTVEDIRRGDERIPALLCTPAAVRFVSYEPALGPLDLFAYLKTNRRDECLAVLRSCEMPGLDWVIVGGESGPGSRPFVRTWAKRIVEQCRAAGVPVFVKQFGSKPFHHLDGDDQPVVRLRLKDRKGGDPSEWPEGEWPREFPEVQA